MTTVAPRSPFPRFASFLADLATTTAELLDADRVDLRSVDRLPQHEQNLAGAAYIWRGHMEVRHDVPPFIEALLASGPKALTPARLDRLREMLGTLLHESIHLALPNDYVPGLALLAQGPADVFLEEGVTEAATQELLPQLLARLESAFPGISRDVPDRTWHYANYVPATRELLSVVSGLPEMRGRDPLKELARVAPHPKFDLLVEQAMEGFGLTYNVPARDRKEVRSRIRAALEAHVERNRHWMSPRDPDEPGVPNTHEPHALSTIMGKQMRMELLRQLHAEGERVGIELPAKWRDDLAVQERSMVTELFRSDQFTGPESRSALRAWISMVGSVRTESLQPPVSRDQHWLGTPRSTRLGVPRLHRPHRARGITR